MILNNTHISTDSSGREHLSPRSSDFSFFAQKGDVHQYIAACIPLHWHDHLEIYVQQMGLVQIGIGEDCYILKPGEGCFINSGVLHSFTAIEPDVCSYHSFLIDPGIIGGMPGSVFDTKYMKPLIEKGPAFLAFSPEMDKPYFTAFDKIFHLCQQEPSGYELKIRNQLSDLILYLHEKSNILSSRRIPPLTDTKMKQMLTWIDENLGNDISLNDIATSTSICPRECQRIFRRYLHYTPMDYLRHRRLLRAASLLSSTDLPITEIALECGFSSPSYFSMQFKKLAGLTPLEYRKTVSRTHAPGVPQSGICIE